MGNPDPPPLVSVVIPTRNSSRTLTACLDSIRRQTYPNVELIVVDNYSTDETRNIAEAHGAVFVSKGPERSAQRNEGARLSQGTYLQFIDSDMELEPTVIEECVEKAQEAYEAIIIPEVSKGEGFWARCRSLEKMCYIGDDDIEAARFFRKDSFFAQDGYNEQIAGGGEDWDLPQRIRAEGGEIGRVKARIVHNEGRLELRTSLQKKYYYGQTIPVYRAIHPEAARRQLRLIRPAFVRNWRRLAEDPVHAMGLLVLKTSELLAGGFGYLKGRFSRERPPKQNSQSPT